MIINRIKKTLLVLPFLILTGCYKKPVHDVTCKIHFMSWYKNDFVEIYKRNSLVWSDTISTNASIGTSESINVQPEEEYIIFVNHKENVSVVPSIDEPYIYITYKNGKLKVDETSKPVRVE